MCEILLRLRIASMTFKRLLAFDEIEADGKREKKCHNANRRRQRQRMTLFDYIALFAQFTQRRMQ